MVTIIGITQFDTKLLMIDRYGYLSMVHCIAPQVGIAHPNLRIHVMITYGPTN